jgi:hypothetical protein
MSKILASLVLGKQNIPTGVTPGAFEVTLFKDGQAGTPVQTTDASVTFEGLDPGTYTAQARRLDATGAEFSPMTALSDPIVIPVVTPDQADVPTSITLSLAVSD